MKSIEVNSCKVTAELQSSKFGPNVLSSIVLSGKGEVDIRSLMSSINKLMIDHFRRDIEGDYDYYYVSVDFVEEKEENEYVLVGGTDCGNRGSDAATNLKVLNKTERELYDSFERMRDFLLNEW